MNTAFDDMENDLDFGATAAPVDMERAAAPRYVSNCSKCAGRGRFISYAGRDCGPCFACKGAGKVEHKTSPEQRAKADVRKQTAMRAAVEDFAAANPGEYEWIAAKASKFDFALNMLQAIQRYGSLTDNQLAAVRRCAARDAERAAVAAVEAAKVAPSADLTALHTVLQRHAKFYAGALTISRRNADQLCWIKHEDAEKVVGKIDHGKLTLWNRPGVDMGAVRDMLDEFNGAPLQTAMKYGKLAGRCCSCGRELTNDGSIEAGIGPICAGKFQSINITRISPLTGKSSTMDLPVTQEQLDEMAAPRRRMVQEIFPQLSAAQREFIKTGYIEQDWRRMFPPEKDEA